VLKVNADPDWLNDSSRAYPVEIDPSVIVSSDEHSVHVYIAQWEWIDRNGEQYWITPFGDALGSLDLRTITQMGKAGGLPEGYGVFTYKEEKIIPNSIYLGTDLNRTLTPVEKTGLETLLGFSIISQTPLSVMWDLLTKYADPTGQTAPKPLIGKQGDTVKLYLGGLSDSPLGFSLIKEEPFSEEHRQRTIAVFQEDYRRNKADGVPLETLQRWTGSTMRDLYGKMDDETSRLILPQGHKADAWKEPHTTINDDFVRTNADALGTATVASVGQGWSWTEVVGDTDIVSNQAKTMDTAATNSNRAETDLSTDDHYAQILCVSVASTRRMGPAIRFNAATTTFYAGLTDSDAGIGHNHWAIHKMVEGTETFDLATNGTGWAAPSSNTLKLQIDGSSLELFQDSVSKVTLTDTSITGNLRTGFMARKEDNIFGAFQAADLEPFTRIRGGTTIKGGTKLQ
jgi:hypothetical protein